MRMYERRRTCTCVASESRHLEFPLALWTSHLHDALVSHSTKPKTTEGTTHEDLLFQPASHSISQYVPSLLLFPLVEWAWRCNFISHWRFSPCSAESFSVTQGSPYNRGAYANSSSTHTIIIWQNSTSFSAILSYIQILRRETPLKHPYLPWNRLVFYRPLIMCKIVIKNYTAGKFEVKSRTSVPKWLM